ncbi:MULTISPECIES: SusC/RagA family TonB-linked outer membrane protein [Niastella]|uniref:SusC/RagA family TonB-linked outer membrane protein n=1 Tax=Niastella soli TaxID=2821487 RepID=A0ABS3YTD3_9BACT|nr:SusC/RagA family TonB-linked outer membrane protein [Niastella soli]MBO9200695.1 SusC/RagA family TonB-linked outer membrane protein [Niastella soli]
MRHVRLLIAFMLLHSAVLAQNRQISGAVKDKAGTGIPSVSIKVKGKDNQTVTDINGLFSLQVPAGNIQLVASSVGFKETTMDVPAGQSVVSISMQEAGEELGEVVVTALGISKQSRKVGYAVSTVPGEQLTQARENNVAASLSGRVAGLKVSGTNGGPGGTVKLLLRGLPSMNNPGSPLFVINGVPMDNTQRGSTSQWGGSDNGDGIGNINPDDIETMTVLKGQAASALYGSRASNGVILITTKSGKKGDFSVDYNLNVMWDDAIDNTEYQYEYGQGVNGLKPATPAAAQASGRLSWGAKLDGSQVIQFDGKTYPYSAQKDNIKNFYRTGSSVTNTIAVSRGGENGSFRLSLSNLNNSSIVRNSGIERKTANLNVDQNITDKLSIKLIGTYIDEQSTNRPQLSDGAMNANNGVFLATNIDENILAPGYDPVTGYETQFSDDEFVTNPWFVVNQYINNLGRKRFITSVAAKYQFTKGLYAQARLGYDITHDRLYKVEPWGTAYTTKRAGSLQDLASTERFELNVDGLIGYTHKLTEDINLDAAIGANLRKNQEEKIKIGGGPFILPYQYSWNNVENFNRDYSFYKTEVHSAYYTLDLAYKNFLTVGTTGRYDNYSTLPTNNNNIFVPSVSASFVFSELFNIKSLDFGKLRASYAVTSNELATAYQTQMYYSLGNNYNGVPIGQFSTTLPSGLLKPFTVAEFEVGTELRFFKSRLNLDVAWFTKKTRDEIMNATYSISTGYTAGYIANGQTENKGLEVQVIGTPIKTNDFNWTITFNLTSVHNKVLKTDEAGNPVNLGQARGTLGNAVTAYVKGYAGPQILAYDYKRDSKGEIVVDGSGYPLRRDTLLAYGSALPTLYGGLNNELTYKGIVLSFLIDYNYGNHIISATSYYSIYRGLNKMTLEGRSDGITKGVTEAGGTNTVKADAQGYWQAVAQRITNTSVLDGDFIKLRQVTLGYNIPADIVSKSVIFRSATISLVGRNLWTIMKHSDNIDPESSFGSTINFLGIEGTSLPSTRTYGVNLNLKFKK